MNVSSERKEKVQIELDQVCVKTRDLRPQFNVKLTWNVSPVAIMLREEIAECADA